LAQSKDSLTVFIQGYGHKGEKYKVYHRNKLILKFKSGGAYLYTFKIPKSSDWKYGSRLNLYVERRGKFGLFYRSIGLNAYNTNKHKYFLLRRSDLLKNKYAFEQQWIDEVPELIRCYQE